VRSAPSKSLATCLADAEDVPTTRAARARDAATDAPVVVTGVEAEKFPRKSDHKWIYFKWRFQDVLMGKNNSCLNVFEYRRLQATLRLCRKDFLQLILENDVKQKPKVRV